MASAANPRPAKSSTSLSDEPLPWTRCGSPSAKRGGRRNVRVMASGAIRCYHHGYGSHLAPGDGADADHHRYCRVLSDCACRQSGDQQDLRRQSAEQQCHGHRRRHLQNQHHHDRSRAGRARDQFRYQQDLCRQWKQQHGYGDQRCQQQHGYGLGWNVSHRGCGEFGHQQDLRRQLPREQRDCDRRCHQSHDHRQHRHRSDGACGQPGDQRDLRRR